MKMIEVRYSLNEAIEILGTGKEIELLRQTVLNFLKSKSKKIQIDMEKNINSKPWDFVAKGFELILNDAAVEVSITDERIIKIKGSSENLEGFTSFLMFDENAISGSHSHYEYYEGHEKWISPNSFPLIIGIK